LGQVLRTVTGWLLIDFEGEPAAPPASGPCCARHCAIVAGMLAIHSTIGGDQDVDRPTEDARLADGRSTGRSATAPGLRRLAERRRVDRATRGRTGMLPGVLRLADQHLCAA